MIYQYVVTKKVGEDKEEIVTTGFTVVEGNAGDAKMKIIGLTLREYPDLMDCVIGGTLEVTAVPFGR